MGTKVAVLVAYVALSLAGLYGMKRADQLASVAFAAGFALYVAGFGVWLVILRLYPLSMAFPLAAGALLVGTQFVGFLFLNEAISIHRIIGASMVLAGLTWLLLFDRSGP